MHYFDKILSCPIFHHRAEKFTLATLAASIRPRKALLWHILLVYKSNSSPCEHPMSLWCPKRHNEIHHWFFILFIDSSGVLLVSYGVSLRDLQSSILYCQRNIIKEYSILWVHFTHSPFIIHSTSHSVNYGINLD